MAGNLNKQVYLYAVAIDALTNRELLLLPWGTSTFVALKSILPEPVQSIILLILGLINSQCQLSL